MKTFRSSQDRRRDQAVWPRHAATARAHRPGAMGGRLMMAIAILCTLVGAGTLVGAEPGPSTRVFQEGSRQLVVYSAVPGLTPSEFYTIRVRSKLTRDEWQPVFALITRSLYSQATIPRKPGSTVSMEAYYDHVKDWSHTYGNIEMNEPVEVEIARVDGQKITKAAVHPVAKARKAAVNNGKVYFTMDRPALIAVDIDGQMDDQDTGLGYTGPPIHTVGLFAHPIMTKPVLNAPGVVEVKAGTKPPVDSSLYQTLYFSAGVHDIGRDFKIYENHSYYIAGDAIVYGTFNNVGTGGGKNIRINGLGTISGDRILHPCFDPAFHGGTMGQVTNKDPVSAHEWKPICVDQAEDVAVEGVCIANSANHSLNLRSSSKGTIHQTFVRWAKVITWRANGDGIGSTHVVEDCFIRTADDCSYMKGDRRRCVFWTDVNGAIFHMAGIPKDRPIVIEDCDVIYARNKSITWQGGRVFSQRAEGPQGKIKVNVLVKDFRVEDTRPTSQTFNLYSIESFRTWAKDAGVIGSSYSGITFQNVTVAARSVNGQPEILHGCAQSPWSEITFDNVVIAGKKVTSLADFQLVNQHVKNITIK